MLNRRSFLQGFSTITLAHFLNGCSQGKNDLSVFILEGSIPPQLFKDFRQTLTGKSVNFQAETSLKSLLALLQNWQKTLPSSSWQSPVSLPFTEKPLPPKANLVTLGDAWLSSAIEKRLIHSLNISNISNLSNWSKLPSRWRENVRRDDQGQPDKKGKIWGAPYRWGSAIIAYNEDKFQNLDWRPQDWSDLWRPELRGRIALVDHPREVIGLTLKKLGHSYNTLDLTQISDLKSALSQLQKQVKFYSSQYYLQPLVVGDVWVSVGWSQDILPASERYSEIKAVFPQSGTSLWSDVWVQPAAEENNPLTQQWIDFCWQIESANRISLFTNALSPIILSRPQDKLPVDIQKNLLLSNRSALEKSEFLNPLPPHTRQEYERLWQEMRRETVTHK